MRELLAVPLQQLSDLAEHGGAFCHGRPAPRAVVERLPSGRDRRVHIGCGSLGERIERDPVVRVNGPGRVVVRGLGPFPRDVQVFHGPLPWLG